jgi:hypothetical protein
MRTADLGKVIELLLRENASDKDLLTRFIQERDEAAFAEIVRAVRLRLPGRPAGETRTAEAA